MDADQKIFREGNQAYYFSSRFLPKAVRDDICKLYGFVYVALDYARTKDTQKKFIALEKAYKNAISDHTFDAIAHNWDDQDVRVVKNIIRLQHKYKFEQAWLDSFFKSVGQDVEITIYKNLEDTLKFLNGSAETIGFMVAKILNLPEDTNKFVTTQSRAMKWVNFINNINSDFARGKCYFPTEELKKFGLKDLSEESFKQNEDNFNKFIQFQVNRYKKWQAEVKKGIQFIPERYQVAIRTAINMDEWIIENIEKTPNIIYEKPLKPRKRRIFRQVIKNTARGTARVTVRTSKQVKTGIKGVKPAAKATVPKIKQAPKVAKEKAIELKDKYIETDD
jgi:phytoene synthase